MKHPYKLFVTSLLTLVSLASAAAPSTGQFLFQRRTATGPFDQFGVAPITGQVFGWDGANVVMIDPTEGSVSSVGLTAPSIFSVAGSPVTSSGTLALSLTTQSANRVWAGPSNGSAATPTFRLLLSADIPDLSDTYQPFDSDLALIAAQANTSFGLALLTKADGAAVRTYIGAGTSNFDGAFSSLTGKPTTLAGYGIIDADALGAAAAAQAFSIQRANHTGTQAATTINTGVVDNTEFNYLDGVTSAIQTQFGTKLDTTGTGSNLTGVFKPNSVAAAGSASSTGSGGAAGANGTVLLEARPGNGGSSATAFNGGAGGAWTASRYPVLVTGGNGGTAGVGANGGVGGSTNTAVHVVGGTGGAGGASAAGGAGGSVATTIQGVFTVIGGNGGPGGAGVGGVGGIGGAFIRATGGVGGTGTGTGTGGVGGGGNATTPTILFTGGAGGASGTGFNGGAGGGYASSLTFTGGNGGAGDGAIGGAGGAAGKLVGNGGAGSAAVAGVAGAAGGAGGTITFSGGAASGSTAGGTGGSITLSAVGTTSAPNITAGTGSPEGVVTGPVASLFLRMDGGAATCLYVKESGTGNTGWVAK